MLETGHLVLYKFSFLPALLFLFSGILYCQRYPDSNVDSLLNRGISLIINQEYFQAGKIFNELNDTYPELPFGEIYLAADEIAKSYDFNLKFDDKLISNNLNKAIDKSESLLDKDENNIWNIYFLALSKGYYAYYQALNKNWFSSLSNGFDAVKGFERCLQKDSLFYDAYTAIGNFEYWESRKTEFLNWIPFVKDNSEEGIKYLLKAVNNPGYNNYLAVHSLQWIYIDQKKYNDVIKLSKSVLNKYPGSRFFKWAQARAYEDVDKKEAIKIYYEILNSYLKLNRLSVFHEILLKHLIAQQYEQIGEFGRSLNMCDEILNIDYSSYENKDKLDLRIEKVKELKKKIITEIGKKN
jgi:hypothetical protein